MGAGSGAAGRGPSATTPLPPPRARRSFWCIGSSETTTPLPSQVPDRVGPWGCRGWGDRPFQPWVGHPLGVDLLLGDSCSQVVLPPEDDPLGFCGGVARVCPCEAGACTPAALRALPVGGCPRRLCGHSPLGQSPVAVWGLAVMGQGNEPSGAYHSEYGLEGWSPEDFPPLPVQRGVGEHAVHASPDPLPATSAEPPVGGIGVGEHTVHASPDSLPAKGRK